MKFPVPTLFLLLSCFISMAQRSYKYNSPGSACYSELFFPEFTGVTQKGVLIINSGNQDPSVAGNQNPLLPSDLFRNYKFVFVRVLNTSETGELDCISAIASYFRLSRPELIFYLIDSDTTQRISPPNSNRPFHVIQTSYRDTGSLYHILDTLTKSDDVQEPAFSSTSRVNRKIQNYKNNTDLGLFLTVNDLTDEGLGLNHKNTITTYGMSFAQSMSTAFSVKSTIGLSVNKPSKSAIKTQAKNQVASSVKNGDSIAHINIDVNGHVMFYGDVLFKYAFNKTKPFRPYIGAGVGLSKLNRYNAKYKDSIDVSGGITSLLNGSQSLSNSRGAVVTTTGDKYFSGLCEVGMDYRINPLIKFNMNVPIRQYYLNSRPKSFTWGVSVALYFTINSNRIK